MPATLKEKKQVEVDDEPEANQLSSLLRKSHAAQLVALYKDGDRISDHIKNEAERVGLDPNMVLNTYFAVLAHVLNPGASFAAPATPPLPRLTWSMAWICCVR